MEVKESSFKFKPYSQPCQQSDLIFKKGYIRDRALGGQIDS